MPPQLGGLIDSDGNPIGKINAMIPHEWPPLIRLIIKREALSDEARVALGKQELLNQIAQQPPGEPQ